MSYLLVCAAFLFASIDASELEQHRGTLTTIKALKKQRQQLTVTNADGSVEFTTDRKTLIYRLTPRNFKIILKGDKLEQIAKDVNQYRKRLVELKEGQLDVVLEAMHRQSTHETVQGGAEEKSERGAQTRSVRKDRNALGVLSQSQKDFADEEEERQKHYGSPTKLKTGQRVIVLTKRDEDDTLLVLVEPSEPKPAKQADKQSDKEALAKSSLQLIKQLIADGKTETARFRLEKLIERYPGTEAAKKAKELLESLP